MMPKSFKGPFRAMVVFSVLYAVGQAFATYYLLGLPRVEFRLDYYIVYPLVMLSVIVGEAVFYWKVRDKNIYRKQSWLHVGLFAFALFLLPVIQNVTAGLTADIFHGMEIRYVAMFYAILYWGMLLAAQGYFVYVLRQCLTRQPAVGVDGQENLLDDILH